MSIRDYKRKALGHHPCKGGSSSSSSTATINTDKRVAVSDGIGLSGDGNAIDYNYSVENNDPDVVKAIAQLGTDAIARSGEAIVQLNKQSQAANVTAWDTTVTKGAELVDHLINQVGAGFQLSAAAIDKFQPTDNKTQDVSLKLGMIAAAAVAATILLTRTAKK